MALVGEPNAGKSTLLNALLGQKLSIVTPKAQTTRHKILGILSSETAQVVLLDTPGLIEPRYALHESMMRHASAALDDADLSLFMVDVSQGKGECSPAGLAALSRLTTHLRPAYLVLNKIDLASAAAIAQQRNAYADRFAFRKIFMISALKKEGIKDLLEAVVAEMPVHPPYYPLDIISEQHQRFFVTEIIREKVFLQTHEEVPYATTVEVVEFKEREEGKWLINANIVVERDSQKGILIGKQGVRLKAIGKASRVDIERFLEHPIYLDLHVKVREKWRAKKDWVKRFGYDEEQ